MSKQQSRPTILPACSIRLFAYHLQIGGSNCHGATRIGNVGGEFDLVTM